MPLKCPARKKAVKQKRRLGAPLGFASQTKPSPSKQDSPDNPMIAKSISLTVLALLKCTDAPEKFSDEINGLFSQNGLPALNLTDFVPPSISSLQKLFTSQLITSSNSELQTNPKEKIDQCILATAVDESNAHLISSKSSGTRNLKSSNSQRISEASFECWDDCQRTSESSIGSLDSQRTSESSTGSSDSQLQPFDHSIVWDGYRLKQHGSSVVSSQDKRSSWEDLICTENGDVLDYNPFYKMIDSGVLPCMQTILEKNEFKAMRSSPKRLLNKIHDSE